MAMRWRNCILSFPKVPGMPVRALRGISRVALKAGESGAVHFDLSRETFPA